MSQKKKSERDYKFSDGELKHKADSIASNVTRDMDAFNTRGVTADTISQFQENIALFDNMPDEVEVQGDASIATELKNAQAEALRVHIRTIRTMAGNVWHKDSAIYRSFGFEGMDEMNDERLYRLGKRVTRVATARLTDLSGQGLTATMIDNLLINCTDFDTAIDNQEAAESNRDIKTQARIESGNLVYKDLVRLCNTGKDLWAATNEAKYNDYVIYDTPGSPPANEPLVP